MASEKVWHLSIFMVPPRESTVEVRRRESLYSEGWQLEELSETGFANEAGFPLNVPLKVTSAMYLKRGNQFLISLKMLLVKQIQES